MPDLPITCGLELCRTAEDVRALVELRHAIVPLTPEERAEAMRVEKQLAARSS